MVQNKSYVQVIEAYHDARNKAMLSRDKKIVRKITTLKKEYEKKREKLEKESEKTMDPKLRREFKQTSKEFSKYTEKLLSTLDR